MHLAHLIPILIEELGHLIRLLGEARVHHHHARNLESAVERLMETQNALVSALYRDAHAHQHLACAADSLAAAQGALAVQMALGGQMAEHLEEVADRLAAVLERIANHLPATRVTDAGLLRDLSHGPHRQAD